MEARARDIVDWCRKAIDDLSEDYGSKLAVFAELEKLGLSKHWVQKFACGSRDNPTQQQLDKLADGLRALIERREAA